jgi:carboxymethylenebutenolidase
MNPESGKKIDLGAVFDAHVAAEFATLDLDTTMATMTDAPVLTHVPVLTGGNGRDAVRAFYSKYFVGRWPADTSILLLSRTAGEVQLVDELIMRFTHDVEIPALLPGVKPTGRKVELPVVVVVGFSGGKIAFERIYWDQASLLVQTGLLDPERFPVTGVEQAQRLLDATLPSNQLIYRSES